jgi:hypothetical protein
LNSVDVIEVEEGEFFVLLKLIKDANALSDFFRKHFDHFPSDWDFGCTKSSPNVPSTLFEFCARPLPAQVGR